VWLVIGLGIALFLKARRPETMHRVSEVFVSGELESGPEARPVHATRPAPLEGSV
jgi:hypothetical protein